MKVEINNIEKGYVTSATVESNKLSTQLTINTRDRWVNHTRETHYKNTIKYHYTNEKDELLAKITIIAETKEDIERLTWLQFEQQNKDQLWIIFLHDEVVNCKCSSKLKWVDRFTVDENKLNNEKIGCNPFGIGEME